MWTSLDTLGDVALIIIDLQRLDIDPNVGALSTQTPDVVSMYLDVITHRVLPNTQRLLHTARSLDVEVIHVRIQSLTADGRDRSPGHKRLGLHVAPSSEHAEFLPEVAPAPDEIILNKTSSDAFHTTSLSQLLRNLGKSQLIMCGVFTHECVASTARSACDLGFEVRVVGDACAAVTPEAHSHALEGLHKRYALVTTTAEVTAQLTNIR